MSANLDLVRSIFADWRRGDFSSAEWADPEIDYVRADGPEPGTWSGLAGMAEAVRAYAGAWDEVRLLMDECRALDGERVLVLYHSAGTARRADWTSDRWGRKQRMCSTSVVARS